MTTFATKTAQTVSVTQRTVFTVVKASREAVITLKANNGRDKNGARVVRPVLAALGAAANETRWPWRVTRSRAALRRSTPRSKTNSAGTASTVRRGTPQTLRQIWRGEFATCWPGNASERQDLAPERQDPGSGTRQAAGGWLLAGYESGYRIPAQGIICRHGSESISGLRERHSRRPICLWRLPW